jgi:hypothetical protein
MSLATGTKLGPYQILALIGAGRMGGRGGGWGTNDVIVLRSKPGASFMSRLRFCTATPVTTPDRVSGETSHRFPGFLPDGRHSFTRRTI